MQGHCLSITFNTLPFMAFMYDYILQLDVSKLSASEVSQCLLYLFHLPGHDAEIERGGVDIKEKLQGRLTELRREKNKR